MSKVVALGLLLLGGCHGASAPEPAPRGASSTPRPEASRPIILCLGTSLTAGLGLDPEQAWPALVQARLDALGLHFGVVNAGVSGETSAGALRRLDWLLRQPVAVLIVETGANDGLRGLDEKAMRANIQALLDRARRQQPPPRLVLCGMQAVSNYGSDYARRFRAVFPKLAKQNHALLVPFVLEGVAGVTELNQADGIHPNAEGQRRVAANVLAVLEPLLNELAAARAD